MGFAPAALEALRFHTWPGNVRELWNVIQRCALSAAERTITQADVEQQVRRQP